MVGSHLSMAYFEGMKTIAPKCPFGSWGFDSPSRHQPQNRVGRGLGSNRPVDQIFKILRKVEFRFLDVRRPVRFLLFDRDLSGVREIGDWRNPKALMQIQVSGPEVCTQHVLAVSLMVK